MKDNLIRKLARAVIALVLLIVVAFVLSRSIPGDPAQRMMHVPNSSQAASSSGRLLHYEKLYRDMGLHLPVFYVSMSSLAVPDSFRHFPDKRFSRQLCRLAYWSGNPEKSLEWCRNHLSYANAELNLGVAHSGAEMAEKMEVFSRLNPAGGSRAQKMISDWRQLQESQPKTHWKAWIPVLNFNRENQFHLWFFGDKSVADDRSGRGVLYGDLGNSWVRGMRVTDMLKFPFLLTFMIASLVLLICFPLSLLTGAWMARNRNNHITKATYAFLVFLYAVPTFWLGTALLVFLASPQWLNWFPTSSPVLLSDAGLMAWFGSVFHQWNHFVIPVIAVAYSTYVYLVQMTYELLQEELDKPYVTALRAKGCRENTIVFRHALKNCLSPLIVSTMSVFPLLMGGTIIVDFLFSMPGLGSLLSGACEQKDFPVISGALLLCGLVSILSFYLTDLLNSSAGFDSAKDQV
ncbi:MAG: ABC transporter permease [Bacteroidia bacterium]|nr:ABC transporter permease [Bacteroidia bacterium]